MSVSIRSPIIAVVSEWASIAFSADRIISGFGLPTKYGCTLVACENRAATEAGGSGGALGAWEIRAAPEPVAGVGPSGLGPVGSGLVAMKREPLTISRIASVMRSSEYVRVSPSTT